MKKNDKPSNGLSRRKFFGMAAAGTIGAAMMPKSVLSSVTGLAPEDEKPATNVADALKYPRNEWSMPGRFPGKVVRVDHPACIAGDGIVPEAVQQMVTRGMLELTRKTDISEAWQVFVSPGEKIGLKINPIGGMLLSTNVNLVKAIIGPMQQAGIAASDITIWDRREFQIYEAGFKKEDFPGIAFSGTEIRDEQGSFYGNDGKLYSLSRIDEAWYYKAEVEQEYDAYTMPYMVNQGKYSYFSKICTTELDKIINLPVLKNAGGSVTICMKNLAYGAITNTSRLHKQLWSETCAEVCAFPPLRDKVVLNIVDGIRGCFDGGPGANPQFITNFNTLLFGSDPVAVDRIGYDIILRKRIAEGIQQEENPKYRRFMELAGNLGLGEPDIGKIELKTLNLG
jgi:uncharacterized protein (DUF362 family)